MELTSLSLHKNWDGPGYKCTVNFKGENGSTELKLLPETSEAILAVVADQIIEASKETAKRLTREVIDAQMLQIGHDNA